MTVPANYGTEYRSSIYTTYNFYIQIVMQIVSLRTCKRGISLPHLQLLIIEIIDSNFLFLHHRPMSPKHSDINNAIIDINVTVVNWGL